MRISFGPQRAVAASTLYEVAWSFPELQGGAAKQGGKRNWWLGSVHADEKSARTILDQIQQLVCAQRGSVALYKVEYDDKNGILSESVIMQSGSERAPFRHTVRAPTPQLRRAFAELVGAPALPRRKLHLALLPPIAAIAGAISVAAAIAGLAFGVIFWLQRADWSQAAGNTTAARIHNTDGQVLIPRADNLCDRYKFDNSTGAIRFMAVEPCGSAKQSTKPHVNAFTDSWRSVR